MLARIDLADFWAKKAREKEGVLMNGEATL
jgi:hypothetical protein